MRRHLLLTALVKYSDRYRDGARRFDVGATCTPTLLPGAIAALKQPTVWGVAEVAQSLAAVNARIATHLA